LMEVDPNTEETLRCQDMSALGAGHYEPHRLTVGPDGYIYTTEWSFPSAPGPWRILVIDPNGENGSFALLETISHPGFGKDGSSIAVMPGGAIVYGDYGGGTCWLSNPARTSWTPVAMCAGSPEYSNFATGHGLVFTSSTPCGLGFGQVNVFELDGMLVGSFSMNAPGLALIGGFQNAVVAH